LGRTLSGMDFYRRVPKELTEATMSGSALSVSCLFLMIVLFLSELRAYLRVETRSEVVLDDVTDGLFQIKFNMTLPRLSCEWVRMDVHDALGHDRINVTSNIRKYPLGENMGKASTRSVYGPGDREEEVAHGEIRELHMEQMGDGNKEDNAIDVTGEGALKELLQKGEITLVNYFAPWCPWCQRLHPVWEHVAGLVKKEYGPEEINMARVDCTKPLNSKVCQDNSVQAYPTIRVYRRGVSELVDAPAVMLGGVEMHGQEHEAYHGDRTVEALVRFAENTLKDNKRRKLEVDRAGETIKAGYQSRGGSEVHTNGCLVEGVVVASRVPGTLELVPRSASHSFDGNLINLTHVIHTFHFEPADDDDYGKLSKRQGNFRDAFWKQMPGLMGIGKKRVLKAKPGERRLDGTRYLSTELLVQHEHYLKVVAREHQNLRKKTYSAYEYTASSNGYVIPVADDLRGIRFSYDISPVKVRTFETSRSLFQFLTGLCAIIGGVYTVFGLLDGATLHTLKILKKDKMGKLG